jgi:glycosyltransferase involved in cell wall biosynthesis
MIKVLHVVDKLSVGDSSIHGVTRLLSWWIPRYDTSKYDVRICSLRNRDQTGQFLEGIGARMYYLNRGKFNPKTLTDLLKLVREEHFNILHLHGYGAATFGRICGLLKNVPAIVHEHMFDKNIPFYQRIADKILSRFTTSSIAVSESVKTFLVQYRSVPSEKVHVIYNGVPLAGIGSKTSPETTWHKYFNIPQSHKVVAIVGRLNFIKGHKFFLEAAKIIFAQFQDVTFLIVGDGELMSSLKDQCNSLGINRHVRFAGHCEDVSSILEEVDIKVISSLSEGVPLTLFEAMAAGCAIVSTNVGGIPEVIEDGVTGFLVPAENPKALAEKITLLLKNHKILQAMAMNAKEASGRFDILNTVQSIERCYSQILTHYNNFN